MVVSCATGAPDDGPQVDGGVRFYELRNSAALTVVNDFSITPNPTSQTVAAGTSTTYVINTALLAGGAETINLTVSGLPAGATGAFSPASVIAGGRSTLMVTTAATTAASTTQFTITGTGTAATHTASASLTVTGIVNCINGTFTSTDVPKAIPDNNATGITSGNSVIGNGTVASLSLSLNITHPFSGDLVVTLISPGNTSFIVSNRVGGSADNIVINNLAITAFNGQAAAGSWKLKVQDLASADIGTIDSWSLTIVGNCTAVVHWSGSATPNLPTIDNGTACTNLTVTTTGGDSSVAKLDISGSHTFCSILRGTLAHNGTAVAAFPTGTFPIGSCTFSFTNRSVPGLSGDSSGTWTLCIIDTDAFGDTGVLNTWAVHD